MKYEVMMGLEVHAELSTKTKIFCGCSTQFGGEPNTHCCPVCSGIPGALPRLNREVVEYAIRLGLTLGCDINTYCKFDRKNYFYPDLPNAYQISQLYAPICKNGGIDIGDKYIRIRQIHMEEDAGKLIHDPRNGNTYMDFNRTSIPLLEIVSQPDFCNTDEVLAYLEKLKETLLYLDICDCKMQEGRLRADINISLRLPGEEPGTRTETKNMNSFKAIARAIEYEVERQAEMLDEGGKVVQETRRWDDEAGQSTGMRSKENAQDYRYFPEPDLLPVLIDDQWLERVKKSLPEMAYAKRERYIRDYKLSASEASVLTSHMSISKLFEDIAAKSGNPTEAAHMVSGEIMRLMNNTGTLPEDISVDTAKLAALITMLKDGKINRDAYKETIEVVFTKNADPEAYIGEKGLRMVDDDDALVKAIDEVLAANSDAIADYKVGKEKAFGFLMGQIMKKLRGSGNPAKAKDMLKNKLD